METEQPSYLIVGAGIFGASTALHLKAAEPKAHVTLLDRTPYPYPYGSSWDSSRIIQDYYVDKFHMRLANEAQQQWRNGDRWKSFYHESGVFIADHTSFGRNVIQNYQDLNIDHKSEMISLEEVRKRWNGVYKDVNLHGVGKLFWNAGCGWANASGALTHMIEAAIASGVTYKVGEMTTLLLDDNQSCHGVRLADESELRADYIVLCTGAHTAKILADSAPQWEELQIKERLLVCGIVTAYARVPSHQMERFNAMPVYVSAMPHVKCGLLPPAPNGLLRMTRDETFSHYIHHKASNQTLSVPPKFKNRLIWGQDVPQGLKDECREVLRKSLGEQAEGLEIEHHRLCWDSCTPDQAPIISSHPHCRNLYFAIGGSFHSYKFLPIIGSYVVQMLHGELEPDTAKRWAWDRPIVPGGGAYGPNGKCRPRRDLTEIAGYEDLIEHLAA